MLKKILSIHFSFLCFLAVNWAQSHPSCGTTVDAFENIRQRLIANKAFLKNTPTAVSRNATTYIPIKFHLVAENDGSGRVASSDILDQLCLLNEVFQEFDIAFYIKDGFNEVNDSRIYNDQFSVESVMNRQRDNNAVNVWIVGDASSGDQIEGVILGYYTPFQDWIVVDRSFIGARGYTLLHEIGHFFSLMHPFFGWGDQGAPPYDETYEGSPAPAFSPSPLNVLNEFADGSNCEIAGDMICDTPADYLYFSQLNNAACRYDRPMLDPKGEVLTPDATLIMGYFLDNCMERFTPQQIDIMQVDLQSNNRAYLRNNFSPNNAITSSLQLTRPIDNTTAESFNKVTFSWQATPNATSYLVEISRVPGFSDTPLEYITTSNSILVEDLVADRSYFWRVTPFNENFTCGSPSRSERFRTGFSTSIQPISGVNDWSLFPNPTSSKKGLLLSVQAESAFKANLKIYALTGQLLVERPELTFTNDRSQTFIDINDLKTGMYFVHLENETGVLNKKIVVE